MFQLTLILLLCCFGFAHAKTDQALPTTDNFIFSQTDIKSPAADNYFMVFKANYEHMEGNYQNAFKSYEKLLQSSPSPEMYGRYVRLLFDTKQYQEVVKMIEKTKPVAGDDLDLQLIYAQSWLNLNKDDKAEELLSGLSKKFPKSEQVAYYSIVYEMKKENLDEALSKIEKFLQSTKPRTKHFLFYYLKSRIHLQKNELKQSLSSIEKSLKLFPQFDKGWLFKALLLKQLGNVRGAIEGYKRFVNLVGGDSAVEREIVQLLFAQERYPEALKELKKMKSDHPEYHFDLALLSWKSGKNKDALSYVNKTLKKDGSFKKAKLLKVEILLSLKKHKEVLIFVEDWLKKSPHEQGVVQTLMLLRKTGVATDQIIEVLQNIKKEQPKEKAILFALADLYLEKDDHQKSLSLYQEVLPLVSDEMLASKVHFQIGYIHFAQGNNTACQETLEKVAEKKNVYPSVYNLLAYSYSEQNKNLDRAILLVDRAINMRPQSPYYLDTKGCVLLKLQKLDEAKEVFKKALEFEPDDKIIQKHLRDVQQRTV